MTHRFADLMFTTQVKLTQTRYGSRQQNNRLQSNFGPNDQLTSRETDFISQRDSFYLATVTETGWPYVQHRGGPKGFLKPVGGNRLAFADFKGNTQLISAGNSATNKRCSLILVDYPNRRRLKLLGHLTMQDVRETTSPELEQEDYKGKVERLATIEVAAFDWNCPQHITPRYSADEVHLLQDLLQEQDQRRASAEPEPKQSAPQADQQ